MRKNNCSPPSRTQYINVYNRNSLEISPLLVIFAVTVGGAYFGVLGMFLSVPVIAVLKIIINDYLEFKIKKKYI
jgi:predicted PurR-regulated permease PerM